MNSQQSSVNRLHVNISVDRGHFWKWNCSEKDAFIPIRVTGYFEKTQKIRQCIIKIDILLQKFGLPNIIIIIIRQTPSINIGRNTMFP
jgi:hypothetical protein